MRRKLALLQLHPPNSLGHPGSYNKLKQRGLCANRFWEPLYHPFGGAAPMPQLVWRSSPATAPQLAMTSLPINWLSHRIEPPAPRLTDKL